MIFLVMDLTTTPIEASSVIITVFGIQPEKLTSPRLRASARTIPFLLAV